MIKTNLRISKMPCDCNTVCNIETFDWAIFIENNFYHFRVYCKLCKKFVEAKALASIELNTEPVSDEIEKSAQKRMPTTIREAKEDLDKYLASVLVEEAQIITSKKEYVH